MNCEGSDCSCHLRAATEGTVRRPVLWASTPPLLASGRHLRLTFPCPWFLLLLNTALITRLDLSCLSLGLPSRCLPLEPRCSPPPQPTPISPAGVEKEGGSRHLLKAGAGGRVPGCRSPPGVWRLKGVGGRHAATPRPASALVCVRGRKREGGWGVEAAPAAAASPRPADGRVPGPRCCVTARGGGGGEVWVRGISLCSSGGTTPL